jgi:hypothetical protein
MHATKARRGSERISPLTLNLRSMWEDGIVISASRQLYARGNGPHFPVVYAVEWAPEWALTLWRKENIFSFRETEKIPRTSSA